MNSDYVSRVWVHVTEATALLTARMVYGDEALAEQFKTQNCINNHDFIMRHSNQISSIIKSPADE